MALRQPAALLAVGVGGLFGYHVLYFAALRPLAPPFEAGASDAARQRCHPAIPTPQSKMRAPQFFWRTASFKGCRQRKVTNVTRLKIAAIS